jgi:hypothetical protein
VSWLFENQILIAAIGIVVMLALGMAWSATGRKEWLYGMGVAFVLMVVGLIVEHVVVTDREAIRATLVRIAHDVQRNDRAAVLRHIYSGKPELKRKAEGELPNYQFTECRITRIHQIDIDEKGEPRSATVEFNVIASGTFRQAGFEVTDTVPRWVRLTMKREADGRWTVADYEHDSPERMIMNRP